MPNKPRGLRHPLADILPREPRPRYTVPPEPQPSQERRNCPMAELIGWWLFHRLDKHPHTHPIPSDLTEWYAEVRDDADACHDKLHDEYATFRDRYRSLTEQQETHAHGLAQSKHSVT